MHGEVNMKLYMKTALRNYGQNITHKLVMNGDRRQINTEQHIVNSRAFKNTFSVSKKNQLIKYIEIN